MKEIRTRKQIRLPDYDYSENGYYFVTVCSFNRQNTFVGAGLASARNNDHSMDNNLDLSPVGKIIDQQWNNIPNYYEHVNLDEYVIMPNHIHGILIIKTGMDASRQTQADARPAPTVSDIICSFKSRCTVEYLRYIKNNNLNMSCKIWQRSFYDHVIRNERSLNAIREYITGNPINWELDIENLIGIENNR